jgi:MerR family transcriptional regulator, heat shock protein HspR
MELPSRGDRDTRALFVISVAAELAGVHPQTLRIYERKGLIRPARTSGRSRRYSEHDIAMLRRIQELTNAGVSLAGVERILELEARLADAHDRIVALEHEVDRVQAATREAVDAVHKSYRRELVPFPTTALVRADPTPRR